MLRPHKGGYIGCGGSGEDSSEAPPSQGRVYRFLTMLSSFIVSFALTRAGISKVVELNEKLENGEKLTKKEEKSLEKYEAGKAVYDDLMKNLTVAVSDTVWNCRDGFMPVLKNLLPKVNGKACLDAKGLLKLAGGLSQSDENTLVQTDKKVNIEYDPETKDTEIVKGTDTIEEYMAREVLPHIPDAVWFFEEDAKKGTVKTGAEIPFTRYFFKYQRPETMEALQTKIMESQSEIGKDLDELFE